MAIQREIMSSGGGAMLSQAVAGSKALAVSAAGTTAATATDLAAAINVITTCTEAAPGVQLPANEAGDSIVVINATAANLRVYPPTGGAFNGGTANVPVTMGANSGATFFQVGTADYGVAL